MRTITLEEHFASPAFLAGPGKEFNDALRNRGPRGVKISDQLRDIGDQRIAEMDAAQIDMQVLSRNSPGVEQAETADAVSVASEANDFLAEAVKKIRNASPARNFPRIPFELAGSIVVTMAALHPLEYIAMNALAGGTRGAYQRFELDYWSAAATEALRRLERRLDHEKAFTETPPSITICIPWREWMVGPMLHKPWKIETDPEQADFIIETERSRCAAKVPTTLIDEVKRFDRTFAWIYAAHPKIGDVPAMSRSH